MRQLIKLNILNFMYFNYPNENENITYCSYKAKYKEWRLEDKFASKNIFSSLSKGQNSVPVDSKLNRSKLKLT